MENPKLEQLIYECELSETSKIFQIALSNLEKFLDEKKSENSKYIDLFLNRIIFTKKKNNFALRFKDEIILNMIETIIDKFSIFQKFYVFEKFLEYFQNESQKNDFENYDIFKKNLISSIFLNYISDENLQLMIIETFESDKNEILEIQINKYLKMPLIFSNYFQQTCENFKNDNYYKSLFKFFKNIQRFQDNKPMVFHFLNKISFNGLLGKKFNFLYFI